MLDDVLDIYKNGHRIEDIDLDASLKDELVKSLYEGRHDTLELLKTLDGIIDHKQDDIVCKGRLSAAVDRAATYLEIHKMLSSVSDKRAQEIKERADAMISTGEHSYDSDAQLYAQAISGGDESTDTILRALFDEDDGKYQMFGSSLGKEDLEERNKLEKKLKNMKANPSFVKLLALMGDAVEFVHNLKKQKDKTGQGAITGLEFGNDIANIVPDEYIAFICPELTNLFLLDYVNENLLQDKIESKQSVGKGDIFIQLDTSGSMEWAFDGMYRPSDYMTRFNCATALIFALMVELRKDNRHIVLAYFTKYSNIVFNSKEDDNLTCFSKLLNLVKYGPNGFTSFNAAWNVYLDFCNKNQPLDFLFITDGEDSTFSSNFYAKEIEKLKTKVITFVIAGTMNDSTSKALHAVSDIVKQVRSFDDLKEMVDLSL